MRIEVWETINDSRDMVWACLTDVNSWPSWWNGHRLMSVTPDWRKGAELVWSPGRPATIFDCQHGSLLDFGDSNMGMKIHRYFKLRRRGTSTTIMLYGVSVEGGQMAPGADAEEKKSMAKVLRDLRKVVEANREKYRALAAAGPLPTARPLPTKTWWKFWQ